MANKEIKKDVDEMELQGLPRSDCLRELQVLRESGKNTDDPVELVQYGFRLALNRVLIRLSDK